MRRPDWLGSEEEGGTGRKGGSGRCGNNIMMDFIALLRNSVTEEKMEGGGQSWQGTTVVGRFAKGEGVKRIGCAPGVFRVQIRILLHISNSFRYSSSILKVCVKSNDTALHSERK